jgi:hypothetical protein
MAKIIRTTNDPQDTTQKTKHQQEPHTEDEVPEEHRESKFKLLKNKQNN